MAIQATKQEMLPSGARLDCQQQLETCTAHRTGVGESHPTGHIWSTGHLIITQVLPHHSHARLFARSTAALALQRQSCVAVSTTRPAKPETLTIWALERKFAGPCRPLVPMR